MYTICKVYKFLGDVMNSGHCQASEKAMLQHLGNLRKMIVCHHQLDNLADFVMHALCSGPCLHIDKAAYFVNNPDFKILKGLVGYNQKDAHALLQDRWQEQEKFNNGMKNSLFHQKVRATEQEHFEKGTKSELYAVAKLADKLEIANPQYYIWDTKHENHGLIIYQPLLEHVNHPQEHFLDSLYYLSFCPVY